MPAIVLTFQEGVHTLQDIFEQAQAQFPHVEECDLIIRGPLLKDEVENVIYIEEISSSPFMEGCDGPTNQRRIPSLRTVRILRQQAEKMYPDPDFSRMKFVTPWGEPNALTIYIADM